LKSLLNKGKLPAKMFNACDGTTGTGSWQKPYKQLPKHWELLIFTVAAWRDNYQSERLKCLQDKARSWRPIEIDGKTTSKDYCSWPCSQAPSGALVGTCDWLAEKVVELGYCEKDFTIPRWLNSEKNELKPH